MEKDVDEVGKIARSIKLKIEELDKEVIIMCCMPCYGLLIEF